MKINIILLPTILVMINACKSDITRPPESPDSSLPSLPLLEDPVPFDKLGSGKIAFERIGPTDNNYSGMYIIDIKNKENWGINAFLSEPKISPEGDKITFTTVTPRSKYNWDVYIMDIHGNNPKQISSFEGKEMCPNWFPDNDRIIFYSVFSSTAEYIPIYSYNINTNSITELIDFREIKNAHFYEALDILSVSKKGICLTTGAGLGIYTFDNNGNDLKKIIPTSSEYIYYSSTWNPAGDKIAVMAIKSAELNIILFNEDGSDSTNIFTSSENESGGSWSGGSNYSLCWSPDGSKILFNRREGYLTSHIYMINADGSDLIKVTSLSGVTDRSLSWGK